MKKTVRDLQKVSSSSIGWLKTGAYYLYLPTVLILGLKTVKWDMFLNQAPGMS